MENENKYEILTQKIICMKGKLKMNMQVHINLTSERNTSGNRDDNM